jgi:hypothetical protein
MWRVGLFTHQLLPPSNSFAPLHLFTSARHANHADSQGGSDDIGRFAAKFLEFRAVSTTELVDPNWGSSDERVKLIHEMEELVVQVESLIETLEEEPEYSEGEKS